MYPSKGSVFTIYLQFVPHQQTPLHLAAKRGRFENTLKYLIARGADINIKDIDGVIFILLY